MAVVVKRVVSCRETAQRSGLLEKTEVKERRRGCVDVGAQQQLPGYRLIDFFFFLGLGKS